MEAIKSTAMKSTIALRLEAVLRPGKLIGKGTSMFTVFSLNLDFTKQNNG
jgi:hypothetical protein